MEHYGNHYHNANQREREHPTVIISATDRYGDDRDFDCNALANGMTPLSAKRREGLTCLLDMASDVIGTRPQATILANIKRTVVHKQ